MQSMRKRTGQVQACILLTAIAAASAFTLSGCNYDSYEGSSDNMPSLSLAASNTTLVAGEVTTISARTRNVVNRDAEISWSTSGGDLKKLQDDNTAQVTFKEPGTYKVTATLEVNGRIVDADSITIKVNPL